MVKKEILIDAPREKVFEAIRNFTAYPQFVKGTLSANERQTSGGLEVDFEIEVIKRIQYTLSFKIKEPESIEWTMLKGEVMKKNNGAWKFEAVSERQTLAHYQVDIGFGWMVPKMIVDQLTAVQLPEMLEAFKDRAEAMA